jgi:hypothetical protein
MIFLTLVPDQGVAKQTWAVLPDVKLEVSVVRPGLFTRKLNYVCV